MSNIINKSNHPVEIKRVELNIWKLRDEIESAIERRMAEKKPDDNSPLDIEDIKDFYLSIFNASHGEEDKQSADNGSDKDSNLDSSGNPLDDDAMAMMAALGEEEEEKSTAEDSDPEKENGADDDAASEMAEALLADQGTTEALGNLSENKIDKKPFKRLPPHSRKIIKGFVFLSDVQMDQIMIFSKDSFVHGQDIVIEFLVTKPFSQTAEIIAVTNISRNSKIISPAKPAFRLQSLFTFKFPGERGALRNFLTSIEPNIPDPPKKLKRPDSDDDDDFDDLGF